MANSVLQTTTAALMFALVAVSYVQAGTGDPDPAFGSGGRAVTNLQPGVGNLGGNDAANACVRQPDGKLVVVGNTTFWGNEHAFDFGVARYNTDGSLDSTFSDDGLVVTDFGTHSTANAVALQSDGKILVAGSRFGWFAIARYNPNGALDSSFGTTGKVALPFGFSGDSIKGIAVQADGKIVVVGETDWEGAASLPSNGVNANHVAIARFNPNGTLDMSFDGDGKKLIPSGSYYATGNAVCV